jgi:PTS system mannose-specific IIC component
MGAAAAEAAIPAILRALPDAAGPLRLGFFAFSALACASGAKALRARSARRIFFTTLGVAVVAAAAVGRFHA